MGTEEIGKQILHALADEPPITNITGFLKSRRGYAISFRAMDAYWKRVEAGRLLGNSQDIFLNIPESWEGKMDREMQKLQIVDCHTHFLGEHIESGIHPSESDVYLHANGHWWLNPDVYVFKSDNGSIQVDFERSRLDVVRPHAISIYRDYLKQALDHFCGKFSVFATPAPGGSSGVTGGRDDLASWDQMNDLVGDPAGNGAPCDYRVYGSIIDATTIFPADPEENPFGLWKLYGSWANSPDGLIPGALASGSVFAALEKRVTECRRQTVAIHWWDSIAPSEDTLGALCAAFPKLNFVIFHAAFPHQASLSQLMANHENLFAEIGGTFAHMILGGDGEPDGDGQNTDNLPIGPLAAIDLLNTLRFGSSESDANSSDFDNADQIVWGTDSIWYGSPVWQIEALWRLNLNLFGRCPDQEDLKARILAKTPARVFGSLG